MPLYQFTKSDISSLQPTTFSAAGISERGDLQRLLIEHLEIIAPETMVISDEFGSWDEGRRRIDLLCLDTEARLVVIELKRTDDGGHMELQALRYAAMVSTMTFDQLIEAHALFRERQSETSEEESTRAAVLNFLGWQSPSEAEFAPDVRIVLVSADFSKEITTTVLWLNDRDLDIQCVRLKPYLLGTQLLVDVQQVIP